MNIVNFMFRSLTVHRIAGLLILVLIAVLLVWKSGEVSEPVSAADQVGVRYGHTLQVIKEPSGTGTWDPGLTGWTSA